MAKGSLRVNGIIVDTDGEIKASTGDSIVIREDDGSAVITVDTAGKVGINTTAPGAQFDIRGPAGTGTAPAGVLRLSTAETSVVDADQLGRVEFIAPLEAGGTDAILVAASIYAEADDTFSASENNTELVFATASSEVANEKMRLTSDGKLGIGITTPASLLDVRGTVQVGVDDTGYDVKFFGATAGKYMLWDESADVLVIQGLDNGGNILQVQDGTSTLLTVASDEVVINESQRDTDFRIESASNANALLMQASSGNVGIGGTPTAQLSVETTGTSDSIIRINHTNATGDPFLKFTTNATNWSVGLDNSDSDKFMIASGSTPSTNSRLTIDTSGKVGIGTTTPVAPLELVGATSSTLGAPNIRLSGRTYEEYTTIGFGYNGSPAGFQPVEIGYYESTQTADTKGDLIFATRSETSKSTAPSVRMIIESDGNVGIGTTNPSELLHLFTAANSSKGLKIQNDDTTALFYASSSGGSVIGNVTNNNLLFMVNNTEEMRLTSDGRLGIGPQTSPGAVLDIVSTTHTGNGLRVYSDQGSSQASVLVDLVVDNTAFDRQLLYIYNDGEGIAVDIHNNGAGVGLSITNTYSPNMGLYVYSNEDSATSAPLVKLHVDNPGFDQHCFAIRNDGTGKALHIDNNGAGNSLHIEAETDGEFAAFIHNSHATNGSGLKIRAADDANVKALLVQSHDAGTQFFTINGDGRVGINSTSPNKTLESTAQPVKLQSRGLPRPYPVSEID